MNGLREKLETVEQKRKRFKQQQFTFIAALEHSREHAHDRTEPVSTVAQVKRYMTQHCINATDRRIFVLFLDIMADLHTVFQLIESSASNLNYSSEALDTCRKLLSPECNISQLRAQHPHDEVNHLSCNEAQNYYSGVVSIIPLLLDLLKEASSALTKERAKTPALTDTSGSDQQTPADNAGRSITQSAKTLSKGTDGWKAAWKPPGRKKI
ncbi:sperm acrosome-associated protein 9 [Trichomycterus rosablanca]|uniref:sperm acrosome-associated protein 9 n=1 Tax=Trichomycterus rosablanca TaxID=2290929 RepID=UPI002F351C71